MTPQELRIRIGAVRADLKAAYQANHRTTFDVIVEAHLHCRKVAGIDSQYGELIDTLAELELQLESVTARILLPYWRARRIFVADLIESGAVRGEENIERTATFMRLIDEKLAGDATPAAESSGEDDYLLGLLHPAIIDSSWPQYRTGHLRDAVFNAFVAIGDLLRTLTGLTLDGKPLVEQALSLQSPLLVLSAIDTESGRNDQVGFMQIISGAFTGIRNPKAHSLQHDLTPQKVAQYLVFASLLARRLTEASNAQSPEA
ncbi:MAG: TIGR02391 family protein [Nitrosospira sp.]|nr:TIGR02391 family protein [Nitrosospira sp.]